MKLPSLRHRKPIVYISLGIFSTLVLFIIAESCIGSTNSGAQSGLFARISATIVNWFAPPQVVETIKPTSLGTPIDSSYLGAGKVAIGTTTLVSVPVNYPDKADKDVYDKSYTYTVLEGNKENYNVILTNSGSGKKLNVDLRIVANKLTDENNKIEIKIADSLTYIYEFNIVERSAPINYELKVDKSTIKIGETSQIDVKLLPKEGDTSHKDNYLRRVYDSTKLEYVSSNPEIATVDEYGVIHGISAGETVISCGDFSKTITVSSESIVKPATNSINVETSGSASLLDYDYVFEKDMDPDEYSVLVYPSFSDTTLEDKSISYKLSDSLSAMIAPYKYDENGFPVYKDDLNRDCVRICGYRKEGDVNLTCFSNVDNAIEKTIPIKVEQAIPTSMTINQSGTKQVYVNDQISIKGTFSPMNTFNSSINVSLSNSSIIDIVNNDSSVVILKTKAVGSTHVTVTSKANPDLVKEFDVNVIAKEAINEDNFTDFHQFFRKFAGHFFLFLITAVFGMIFFATYFEDYMKMYIYLPATLLIGFITAGLSELIQYFIPSRSGLMLDVGIDFLGYFIGTLIVFVITTIIFFIKKKKNKQE